jgi:hypothetical protein
VEGSPRGRPSLKGKLWMPGESRTGTPPVSPKYKYPSASEPKFIVIFVGVKASYGVGLISA